MRDRSMTTAERDLRSNANERKRVSDAKSKWQPKWAGGSTVTANSRCGLGPSAKERPCPVFHTQRCQQKDRLANVSDVRRKHVLRKQDTLSGELASTIQTQISRKRPFVEPRYDSGSVPSDTEWDSEEDEASKSLNAPQTHGELVLEAAVAQAVTKFEDGQTRKLVQEEYEVLDALGDHPGKENASDDHDDDGFELV